MPVTYTHICENAKKHEYVVNLDDILRTSKIIDPTTVDTVYSEKLPNNQIVTFEPVRFETIILFLQKMDQKANKTPEAEFDTIVDAVSGVIREVDGINDREMIKEWIRCIPASYVEYIKNCMERIADWGPDFVTTQKCKDCGEHFEVAIPLNPISFFI